MKNNKYVVQYIIIIIKQVVGYVQVASEYCSALV